MGPELEEFLNAIPEDNITVNIGSMSRKIIGVYNLDISYRPNISIVADAHDLPFREASLDALIVKNVFEHWAASFREAAQLSDLFQVLNRDPEKPESVRIENAPPTRLIA